MLTLRDFLNEAYGSSVTFTAQEHFHNGEIVKFKVPTSQLRIADKKILLTGKKVKELNKKLCGISGCHCGGLQKATITDSKGYEWSFIQTTQENTEELNEATKTPSFRTYVKETFGMLSKLPKFSVRDKISYGHIPNKESANFSIMKQLGRYDDSNREELQKKFRVDGEKIKKSVLQILYCPAGIINAQHKVDYEFKWGDEIESQTIAFTDTKNSYNVTVVYKLIIEQWGMFVQFDFEFTGADTVAQTTFVDFPQFVPGAILHASWGYSMTINTYYEIVKRTNKTVYAVEIGKTDKDGGGLYGHEVPNPKVKKSTVYSGRISPSGYVKIDGKHCRIWDGKPNYYNSLD